MNESVEAISPVGCSFGDAQSNPVILFYCVLYTIACALFFGLLFFSRLWSVNRWLRGWTQQQSTESSDHSRVHIANTQDASQVTP